VADEAVLNIVHEKKKSPLKKEFISGQSKYSLHNTEGKRVVSNLFVCREQLTDVTLSCGGTILNAHSLLLSVCSPYFRWVSQVFSGFSMFVYQELESGCGHGLTGHKKPHSGLNQSYS
jgi:hypothetical protein